MDDNKIKDHTDCADIEGTTHIDHKINENSGQIPFKKPIFAGKIGRLPKKVNISESKSKTCPTDKSSEITDSPKDIDEKQLAKSKVKQNEDFLSLQYNEPDWSGLPKTTTAEYFFQVLKDGSIIDSINLMGKCYWVFGRLVDCDIYMQHPTVSRHHAVLQYRSEANEQDEPGFYIYDLGSTHGTFLNKNRLKSRTYVRIQVGHMLKLGCSTRSYLLNGPEEDSEKESELTVTELKQKRQEEIQRIQNEKQQEFICIQKEEEERLRREEEKGVDWGMGDDADEEMDLSENPYAKTTNEDLYLDDPKKTLRGYFEREGLNLEYDCSEQGMGQFLCKVELPIDDERGKAIFAEVIHKGKKKDAVIQCALEACRILDRYDLLRQAVHESRKRKTKDWSENDYYDSDEDTFLDRTGTIEKKREKRMNAKNPVKAETYESLLEKEQKLNDSIKTVELQLIEAQKTLTSDKSTASGEDSLDAFMKNLKDSKPGKSTISKLKSELTKLKQEHAKVVQLVNIVRPASLPPLVSMYGNDSVISNSSKAKILPIFGKRKKIPVSIPQNDSKKLESTEDVSENEEKEEEDTDKEPVSLIKNTYVIPRTENKGHEQETTAGSDPTVSHGIVKKNDLSKMSNIKSTNSHLLDKSLRDCQEAFSQVVDKFKTVCVKICSVENSCPEQKLQSLVAMIRQQTNKIQVEIDSIMEEDQTQKKIETSRDENSVEKKITASETSEVVLDQTTNKKKNQKRIESRLDKIQILKQKGYQEDAGKEDYNMWLPPPDQQGDGRTKLNDKFGY